MRSLIVLCCSFWLVLANAATVDPDYSSALGLSWLFYEAQQSGNIACWNRVAWWQPGGYRVPSHLNDGKSDNIDLSGGWYDAGDHIKNTQALGWAVSTLVWGALEFPQAYESTKQKTIMMRNVKWAADWIVKAHYQASDDPKKNGLVGQVGDPTVDHLKWWKPNDEPQNFCRAVIKVTCDHPGADVASEAAAALTAVSIVFKETDAAYSADLLKHARQLFAFAKACPGIWSLDEKYTIYPSNSYGDDLAWAAAWLCKADGAMCKEAVELWNKAKAESKGKYNSDWDNVFPQTTVLLMSSPLNTDRTAVQPFISYMETLLYYWQDSPLNCTSDAQDFKTCMSNNGILFTTRWGNVPKAANVALLSLAYAKHLSSKSVRVKRRCWARQQVSLMLGNSGRSFMVGFGANSPQSPHHRSSSCPTDACKQCGASPFNLNAESIDGVTGANANVLYGALVGGQDSQGKYTDVVTNYKQNEAAVDWNAGVTGALAGLVWFKNAFPATTWQQYCSQNLQQPDAGLFDDSTPSTEVAAAVVPTFNASVRAAPSNSAASAAAQSPAAFLKKLLDPETGREKCSGVDTAAGPAPTCPTPTQVGADYAAQCQTNYYGKQRKEAASNGAVASKFASGLVATFATAFVWLLL